MARRANMSDQPDSTTPAVPSHGGYTYADAGVSIAAGNALVRAIAPLARSTRRPGADADLGGFGGIFDLKAAGFTDPLLVAANDGVGTKLKLAIEWDRHEGVGVDLVAMCANDLIVQGAEPLFFLDYYASGKLENGVAERVVASIAEGCKQAGCALIGGETAEMPGMYAPGDYDLAGFCVGAVERDRLLTGAGIAAGDVVLGLASSGVHSNGFSLVRRLAADKGWKLDRPSLFDQDRLMIDVLMAPTRIYVASLLPLLRDGKIKGLAHITGGGLLENIPRVLPEGHPCGDRCRRLAAAAPDGVPAGARAGSNRRNSPRTFNMRHRHGGGRRGRRGGGGRRRADPGGRDGVHDRGDRGRAARLHRARLHRDVERPRRLDRDAPPVSGPAVNQPKIAILISGRGSNMMALVEQARGYEVALVASDKPDAPGLAWARDRGLATWALSPKGIGKAAYEAQLDAALRAAGVTVIALAGYMRLVSDDFVTRWRDRIVNIHPSLLPLYKGLDTHRRANRRRAMRRAAARSISSPRNSDGGRLLGQTRVPILPGD
ncbi:hypothetical protein SASPL_156562 [Salvia splendens]|uniref:phosphoribosylformylglycinamidine cyclo-ligase n=1 Tax=Salvia splendens TaxID=180675 RepID=A0A8X8VWF6_SALSN|nr:hypothetical protein SASPL_156562 [Salvia splendens]